VPPWHATMEQCAIASQNEQENARTMIIWTPLYNSIAPGKRMTREIAGNNNHLMRKATTCEADMAHEIIGNNCLLA
jgi:hypothetical protein